MISRVLLKNVATFDDNGSILTDLKKISFIYGTNGTGKTTVSNYLLDQSEGDYNECTLDWDDNIPLQTLVYNKKFRESIFSSDDIKGIFTIGEQAPETIKRLEQITQELDNNKKEIIGHSKSLEQKRQELESLEADFADSCWASIYKKYEKDFKDALRGSISKKNTFRDVLLSKYSSEKNKIAKSFDVLKDLADKIYRESTLKYNHLPAIPDFSGIASIYDKIFTKKIIGKNDVDIAPLISKLNDSDWVSTGRSFIQNGICPFCQQKTITDKFIKQLDLFFDESYKKDIESLNAKSKIYAEQTSLMLNYFDQIEKSEVSNVNSQLDQILFSASLKTLHSQISENIEKLHAKQKEPSLVISPVCHDDIYKTIIELLTNAESKIKKHNDFVDNLETEKNDLKDDVWIFFVQENKLQIELFKKKRNDIENAITSINMFLGKAQGERNALESEQKELNKKNISTEAAIDIINATLKEFGFMSFRIVHADKPNFYSLQREDGTLVKNTLSEGEITFICFLYFIQLVHGSDAAETLGKEKVLVIDDPISSLDSNVLFIVSTMIKEEIKKTKRKQGQIKQIIVLTHNIYFFKEVSFSDGRAKDEQDVGYWIIRKNMNKSYFTSYENRCPIISSYDLLWKELKEYKDGQKVSCITIQNVMRRIIEHYFKLLGKYSDESLLDKFVDLSEKEVARSLLVWINDGSHFLPDDLFVECSTETADKYYNVFEKIFENTDQKSHYDMMMGIKNE